MPDSKYMFTSTHRAASLEFIRSSTGFAVATPRGQKAPAPNSGWDPGTNSIERSKQILHDLSDPSNDSNIGVHLHGNMVDVDVDGDALDYLVPALDSFLPSCAHVWGTTSRPRTHRVYMLKQASFNPSDHSVLRRIKRIQEVKIEVRGGPLSHGHYSILPGSIHPSGDRYLWSDLERASNSPTVVDINLLIRAIRLSGVVAVLAPYWQPGIRNDLVMAFSGFLHRVYDITMSHNDSGFVMDRDACERFLDVFLSITGDDPADRSSRMKTFHATWSKAESGTPVLGASTIAEITGDPSIVSKLYTLLMDSPDIERIDRFISRFVVWRGEGRVIDLVWAREQYSNAVMTRKQLCDSYGHEFITVDGKKRLLADSIFHMSATRRVDGLTFDPSTHDVVVDDGIRQMVNQWSGFELTPYSGDVDDDDMKPLYRYLFEVVSDGNPLHCDWVVQWLAHIFQSPDRRAGTALALVGKSGAGKSILGHQIVMPIIGKKHSASINNISRITNTFNTLLDNKLFVQCDEATNNKQKATAARLKALITDPTVTIEAKFMNSYDKPNLMRFLFTSNDVDDALLLSDGQADRRYTVLKVSSKQVGRISEYWSPFVKWLRKPDTLAKIYKWFLQQEVDWDFISKPLITEAKKVMQGRSTNAFNGWLSEMAARGHPLSEEAHAHPLDAVPALEWKPSINAELQRHVWPNFVNLSALAKDYHEYCKRLPFRNYDLLNEQQILKEFKDRALIAKNAKGSRRSVTIIDDKTNRRIRTYKYLYPIFRYADLLIYLEENIGVEHDDRESAETYQEAIQEHELEHAEF